MRRKPAKTNAGGTVTPEDLLEELSSEALAHSLQRRAILRVFLVFALPHGGWKAVANKDDAFVQIQEALMIGGQPVGFITVENLQPDNAAQVVFCRWRHRPAWRFLDLNEALALLERVKEHLSDTADPHAKKAQRTPQ